jgi:hypothetical protein
MLWYVTSIMDAPDDDDDIDDDVDDDEELEAVPDGV